MPYLQPNIQRTKLFETCMCVCVREKKKGGYNEQSCVLNICSTRLSKPLTMAGITLMCLAWQETIWTWPMVLCLSAYPPVCSLFTPPPPPPSFYCVLNIHTHTHTEYGCAHTQMSKYLRPHYFTQLSLFFFTLKRFCAVLKMC